MVQQRSFLLFENSIKSDATRKTYLYSLNYFLKFYHIKDYDSLAVIAIEKLQRGLQGIETFQYVLFTRNKVSSNI